MRRGGTVDHDKREVGGADSEPVTTPKCTHRRMHTQTQQRDGTPLGPTLPRLDNSLDKRLDRGPR